MRRTFEGRVLNRQHDDSEDQGLAFDMATVISRRKMLSIFGIGAGAAMLSACGTEGRTPRASTSTTSSTSVSPPSNLVEMKTETAGPYPGDGSNGPDILDVSGVERRDIRTSIGGGTTAAGVPMTLTMTLVDISNNNSPMSGAAVYVWHCDAEGRYSMYDSALTNETYLRGVQVADDTGAVTFSSIVPDCYSGRWPHIHFEVFPSKAAITDAQNNVLTSQIALREDTAKAVYAMPGYGKSSSNLASITLDTDNVFSDGWEQQVASVTGDVSTGFQLIITVPIDPTTEQVGGGIAPPTGGAGGPGVPGGPGGPSDQGGPRGAAQLRHNP